VIGEVWEDATNKVAYGLPRKYALGRGLDSVMNYPLRSALIDFLIGRERAALTRRRLLVQKENYPKPMYYALMNLMGSHDRARIINVLAGRDAPDIPEEDRGAYRLSHANYRLGADRFALMMALVAALPGMPTLYYGDEAGLQGLGDPYCRFTYPWGDEDGDLLSRVRALLLCRRHVPALRTGEIEVFAPHPDVLCVVRTIRDGRDALDAPSGDGCAVMLVNRAQERRRVSAEVNLRGCGTLFSREGEAFDFPGGVLSVVLEPMSCKLLLDEASQAEAKGFVKSE
jgi:4-alpha-glucanotransferase